jgi:hypothetical protein
VPYEPTTPTLALCDDLATYLSDLAEPKSPATVRRAYLHRIDLATTKGRHVVFFPTGYDNRPADRGEDWYTHRVTALAFHRYEEAAEQDVTVPAEWVDQEVDWVHTYIVQGLEFSRDGRGPEFNLNLSTLSADVPALYDAERLVQQKCFYCAIEMVFEELRTA